jgi:hypothetical protein
MFWVRIGGVLAVAFALWAGTAGGQQTTQGSQEPQAQQESRGADATPGDLTPVSIENLMNMNVTSVSKTEEKLSRTAAAVFVNKLLVMIDRRVVYTETFAGVY